MHACMRCGMCCSVFVVCGMVCREVQGFQETPLNFAHYFKHCEAEFKVSRICNMS